ncbi:MAG TPA: LysM domain-containing protein [Chitinophagaceae bacterium]|jgi:LysM repeat protein|nr:LysM domain-containing protein [Chitinophagaceae bacterium]
MENNRGIQDQSGAESTPPGPKEGIITEHIVEETDTLPEIAAKYHLSIEQLLAANKETLHNTSEMMQPGARILIPNTYT